MQNEVVKLVRKELAERGIYCEEDVSEGNIFFHYRKANDYGLVLHTIAVTEEDVYVNATVLQLHYAAETVWSHPSVLSYLNEINCQNAGVYCKFTIEDNEDSGKRLCLMHSPVALDIAMRSGGITSVVNYAIHRVELLMNEGLQTIILGIGDLGEKQACLRQRRSISKSSLSGRFTEVSTSVKANLNELEIIKDELERYKDLIEEKAQAARERADSYSSWNDRAEERASELEDKLSEIEILYNEIESAYDELYRAEMALSLAVIGTYVLD